MTIVEALKAKKIPGISVGNRWLVFDVSNIEIRYIVRQNVGNAFSKVVCITESEDEAVKWLIGEE